MDKELLAFLYRTMVKIRKFEEKAVRVPYVGVDKENVAQFKK